MILALAPALVTVLGQSALRSLLLGALVFMALRLVRLRDLRAETAIWTVVLVAALAMPVLTAAVPGVSLRLPAHALSPIVVPVQWPPASGAALPSLAAIAAGLYLLGVLAAVLRILAGLTAAAALYARADPIGEPWARGKAIRASAAVDGPLSFARCILLPADYQTWPETKLNAVLAHEECHLRRGDFFIQLLASVHRALFWFSPFPWWLQRKLGELAETASDAAGARRIGDPAGYAEILVGVTRAARPPGILAQGSLAMAHGPGLAKRVDHILAQAPERVMSAGARLCALAAVATTALALAGVHAAALAQARPAPAATTFPASRAEGLGVSTRPARPGVAARASDSARRASATRPVVAATPTAAAPGKPDADPDQPSYDPLAVLRDNDTVAVLPVLLTGRGAVKITQ